jgi:predicted nuclease with TOPRIM domain
MKQYLGELLAGSGMAVLTWLLSRRKTRNDFLKDLQESINLLAAENTRMLEELIEVKKQNARLICEVEALTREKSELKTQLTLLNRKLDDLKP